jgi:hypothetical protein
VKKRKYYFVPTPSSDVETASTRHVVLKVRRLINQKGYPTGTEIDIKSTLLRNALVEFFKGIEGLRLNESPPVISPELLFHSRVGLAERVKAEEASSEPNKALIEELGVALQYIAEDHASTQASLESLLEHSEITFSLLWTIFPPNVTVYTKRIFCERANL